MFFNQEFFRKESFDPLVQIGNYYLGFLYISVINGNPNNKEISWFTNQYLVKKVIANKGLPPNDGGVEILWAQQPSCTKRSWKGGGGLMIGLTHRITICFDPMWICDRLSTSYLPNFNFLFHILTTNWFNLQCSTINL